MVIAELGSWFWGGEVGLGFGKNWSCLWLGILKVGRFAMGGFFTTNVYAEHKTFGYHKTVCRAQNPAYCKCVVIASGICSMC